MCTQVCTESTFASLTTGKWSTHPGAWSKQVVPILLMSNGCFLFLGASCDRSVADSLFKRRNFKAHDWMRLQSANGSAHARAHRQHSNTCNDYQLWHVWYFYIYVAYAIIFFYTVILTFFIFGMFVCCCPSLCVISKVNARCGLAQRCIFNNKKYIAQLTLD